MKVKVGLVDDHQLFLKSLGILIESFGNYEVQIEAVNGQDLATKMAQRSCIPDILLIDVNMPQMDGIETTRWMNENYPSVKTVALTMNDSDRAIIKMFKSGCCGYLLKDIHPTELEKALAHIQEFGYYNSDKTQRDFRKLIAQSEAMEISLTPKEKLFLPLACSELTYKEIASKMQLSERTIDGYRESLFGKFNVQSRVGLCLEAIRRGLITL